MNPLYPLWCAFLAAAVLVATPDDESFTLATDPPAVIILDGQLVTKADIPERARVVDLARDKDGKVGQLILETSK